MNHHEFNQLCIDQAMIVHNHCMDTCLEPDSEAYIFWSTQRVHMKALCSAAAIAAREQSEYITRYSSHKEPLKQRLLRLKAKRLAALCPDPHTGYASDPQFDVDDIPF